MVAPRPPASFRTGSVRGSRFRHCPAFPRSEETSTQPGDAAEASSHVEDLLLFPEFLRQATRRSSYKVEPLPTPFPDGCPEPKLPAEQVSAGLCESTHGSTCPNRRRKWAGGWLWQKFRCGLAAGGGDTAGTGLAAAGEGL